MKTKFYLGTLLVLAIHVMVKSQTPANLAFEHNDKFVLGYAYYTEQEKREFSTVQDPSELIIKAEELIEKSNRIKKEAAYKPSPERERLLSYSKEIMKEAEIRKIAASELLAYYNRIEFSMMKSSFISALENYNEFDSTTITSKKLLLSAVRNYKFAKQIREEAYAHEQLSSIIASLHMAEEKEVLAIANIVKAHEILRSSKPIIIAQR
ncbi:MAG: hypothetical protein JNL69_09110 [Bacteroidia bacterium]|nr:hypothetical protein [Bacteroidia bacterium]